MSAYDITPLGSPVSLGLTQGEHAMRFIPGTNRVAVMTFVSTTDRRVQVYEVNRSTGVITALSSPLTFYSSSQALSAQGMDLIAYDETHLLLFWKGAGNDGFCRSFNVDASTGEVTAWGSQLEFDTADFDVASVYAVPGEPTRFLLTGMRASNHVKAQVVTLNTSTGALTFESGEWSLGAVGWASSADFLDATRLFLAYTLGSDIDFYAIVLAVDEDWSVDPVGPATKILEMDTLFTTTVLAMSDSVVVVLTKSHEHSLLHVLSVDPDTGAISHLDTPVEIAPSGLSTTSVHAMKKLDSEHFIVFFAGADNDGFVRTYHVDTSTGELTMVDEVEFDSVYASHIHVDDMGDGLFVCAWLGDGNEAFIQAFQVELPAEGGSPLLRIQAEGLFV